MPSKRLLIIGTALLAAISVPAQANMNATLVALFADQADIASSYLAHGHNCGNIKEVEEFKASLINAALRSGASNTQIQSLSNRIDGYKAGYNNTQCELSPSKAEENLNIILYMTGANMNTARD